MRIPARRPSLAFAAIMSFLMALLTSGIITAVNRGIDAACPAAGLRSFAIARPVAFPLVLRLAPRVRSRVVAPP